VGNDHHNRFILGIASIALVGGAHHTLLLLSLAAMDGFSCLHRVFCLGFAALDF
jgi:hypothetical protein